MGKAVTLCLKHSRHTRVLLLQLELLFFGVCVCGGGGGGGVAYS